MEPDDEEHEQLLQRVARQYWVQGQSQHSIGEEISFSRASVSRLLDEARRRGVVRFLVGEPFDRDLLRERALLDALRRLGPAAAVLSSTRVVVLPRRTQAGDRRLLGRHAARLLSEILRPGDGLAIASSRSVAPVTTSSHLLPRLDVVVELLGSGRPGRGAYAGAEFAAAVGARHVPLPTAFIHRTSNRAAAARSRSGVADAIEEIGRADVALFGAGAVTRFDGTGTHAPVEAATLAQAAQDGAVGHVLGVFLDSAGSPVATAIDPLRVGVGIELFRSLSRRVLLAYGAEKAAIIGSTVAAGLVTDLVTDDAATDALLAAGPG